MKKQLQSSFISFAMSLPATSVNPVHHRDTPTGTPHRSHSFKAQPTQIIVFQSPRHRWVYHAGLLAKGQTITALAGCRPLKGLQTTKAACLRGGYSPVGDTDGFAASKVPASWSLGVRLGKNNFKVGSQPKVDHNQASQTILA